MRKFVLSIAAACAGFCFPQWALAADLARPVLKAASAPAPAYNWNGVYVGVHAGYGWADIHTTVIDPAGAAFPVGTVFKADPDGWLGGVQIGFNWQSGNWVFGIEGEYAWADIDANTTTYSTVPGPALAGVRVTIHNEIESIALLTGRIGYAWNNSLWYVKGGWAWADASSNSSTTNNAGADLGTTTGSSSRNGWTIGAGWEYGFAPNWSWKVEYNYIDLGTDTVTVTTGAGVSLRRDSDVDLHLVKFGVNYRFDWGKTPVAAKY
jgi:outer membrane immunogenic protein